MLMDKSRINAREHPFGTKLFSRFGLLGIKLFFLKFCIVRLVINLRKLSQSINGTMSQQREGGLSFLTHMSQPLF